MIPASPPSPLSRQPLGADRLAVLLLFAVLLNPSCTTNKPPKVPAAVVRDGRVSYEAVLDPNAPPSKLVPQVDYLPPAPAAANASPPYPESLLNLSLPPQKIVIRVVVDERGQITEVRPSGVPSEADPAYQATFEVAISNAVKGWQFTPAKLRTYIDGPDPELPAYRVLESEKPTPSYFDIRFIFEVREGKGIVTSSR